MRIAQLAGLHGAAAYEYGGDVKAHGGHKHTRGDLVAVAYAYQRIGLVGIDHVLNAIGNDIT